MKKIIGTVVLVALAVVLWTVFIKSASATTLNPDINNNLGSLACGVQNVTISGDVDLPTNDNSGDNREQFRLRVTLDGNEILVKTTEGSWSTTTANVAVGSHTIVARVQHRTSTNGGGFWSIWSNVTTDYDSDTFTISACPPPPPTPEEECEAQEGMSWVEGACVEDTTPPTPEEVCEAQEGMSWDGDSCEADVVTPPTPEPTPTPSDSGNGGGRSGSRRHCGISGLPTCEEWVKTVGTGSPAVGGTPTTIQEQLLPLLQQLLKLLQMKLALLTPKG